MARQWAIADQVRNELTRATAGIAQTRQEILERFAVHTERNAIARDAMIREVNAAIVQMEQSLLAQAEDFQNQKHQFDAAAERDRATSASCFMRQLRLLRCRWKDSGRFLTDCGSSPRRRTVACLRVTSSRRRRSPTDLPMRVRRWSLIGLKNPQRRLGIRRLCSSRWMPLVPC